jgi:signal transduction histidine kinase
MKLPNLKSIRVRLALWCVAVLAVILLVYVAAVISFQYAQLQRQMYHDEIQDVETVEGLFSFNAQGQLVFDQRYFARPSNQQLIDRFMEVRDVSGTVLFRSATLKGQPLGDLPFPREGVDSFSERSVRLRDGTRVFMISHVHPLQGRLILIRLGFSLAPLTSRLWQFLLLLILALPVALLASTYAAYFVAQRALSPLDAMAVRAEQITVSNLSERLVIVDENDELGHMARVLNELLERLERAFAEMKRFTADAAHELRTPLAALRGTGELALERTRDQIAREAFSNMLEEATRLNQTVDALLLLAKAETQQLESTPEIILLPELVSEILALLELVIEERKLTIIEQGRDDIRQAVRAERSFLRMALLNVIHNAVKFSPTGSVLQITYSHQLRGALDYERVCVQDEGPGIAAGEHEKVLARFFTSRNPDTAKQSGAGLGLSIAKLAVERSGGRLFFEPSVSLGAHCCIDLPVSKL